MYCFKNVRVFDGQSFSSEANQNVFVANGNISEISDRPAKLKDGTVIDCAGRALLPGLIDAHIHAYAAKANLSENDQQPSTYVAQHAGRMLGAMLDRGFTTARDCGGADHGLSNALRDGLISGPDLFYCGKLISQTGGHGDFRHPHHGSAGEEHCWACGCDTIGHVSICADGVDEVTRAVRENFRRGASFIKFAASGGVSSLAGSISALQFGNDEIRAIVEESERHEAYCTAHIHPDAGIRRAIELGVHCVEHASFIEKQTADMAAAKGTFVVPTLSIGFALLEKGDTVGMAKTSQDKLRQVMDVMMKRLENLKSSGVKVGFGTDLLGPLESRQCGEFQLRGSVFTQLECLQQATRNNAELLGLDGIVGTIKVGARADILVMDGDPENDPHAFQNDGSTLKVIMQRGRLHKCNLESETVE
ncbi:MAG: amidohydrolase family protein [Methanosarcinaceae archaeon]|nr:amidohydrolase family protein [Methanosarcinaceae archaeon]